MARPASLERSQMQSRKLSLKLEKGLLLLRGYGFQLLFEVHRNSGGGHKQGVESFESLTRKCKHSLSFGRGFVLRSDLRIWRHLYYALYNAQSERGRRGTWGPIFSGFDSWSHEMGILHSKQGLSLRDWVQEVGGEQVLQIS